MPLETRTYVVDEGGSVDVLIDNSEIEFYSFTARSVDGTARAIAAHPSYPDYSSFNLSGSGSEAYLYTVNTLNDSIYEGPVAEEFYAEGRSTLWFEDDAGELYSKIYDARFTFQINDEADRPNLSVEKLTAEEGNASKAIKLIVSADHAASFDYEVTVRIANGSADFDRTSVTVVMPAYQTSVEVNLELTGDLHSEVNPSDWRDRKEVFQVTAQSEFSSTRSSIEVVNDDGPVLTITSQTGKSDLLEIDERGEFGKIMVLFSEPAPYDIDISVTVDQPDSAADLSFVKTFRIAAGQTKFEIGIAGALEDIKLLETREGGKLVFTASAVDSIENVYFDANGARSFSLDVIVKDELLKELESPSQDALTVSGKVRTATGLVLEAVSNGLLATKGAEAAAEDMVKALGKAAIILEVSVNVVVICAELRQDLISAENSSNEDVLRSRAYVKAEVNFFVAALGAAYAAGSIPLTAMIISQLALTGVVLPVLVPLAIGFGSVVLWQSVLEPLIRSQLTKQALDWHPEAHPETLGPLSQVPGVDGPNTYVGSNRNEAYLVDNTADRISERAKGGIDLANSTVDYTLLPEVEALVLRGQAIVGVGNNSSNYITGTERANKLDGMGGDDVLLGGAGSDTLRGGEGGDVLAGSLGDDDMAGGSGDDSYYVDSAGDRVIEVRGEGIDTVHSSISFSLAKQYIEKLTLTGDGNVNVTGNSLRNTLIGNGGANRIDGAGGADTMIGGAGNDTFVVDEFGDQVFEEVGGGIDAVATGANYFLAAGQEIEEIRITIAAGDQAINLSGNEFAQTILGNGGANRINGGGGADTMIGRGGDDTYLVDNAGDRIIEAVGGGRDTVSTGVSYSLAARQEIEELRVLAAVGDSAINLTGNSLAQTLIGSNGVNILDGAWGNDVLTGRAGADVFLFTNALGAGNVDRITDFASEDTIRLSDAIFTALAPGQLAAGAFKNISTGTADTSDRILYKQATGELFYDADGSGGRAMVKFAVLDNKATLTAADFFVV